MEYKRVESSFEKQKVAQSNDLFYGWQVQIARDIFACASNKNTKDNLHAPFQPYKGQRASPKVVSPLDFLYIHPPPEIPYPWCSVNPPKANTE